MRKITKENVREILVILDEAQEVYAKNHITELGATTSSINFKLLISKLDDPRQFQKSQTKTSIGVIIIGTMTARQLKPREIKYVKAKAEGKSNTEAAMIATGTKSINSAKTLGNRLSTNVNVQAAVAEALKKNGITLDNAIAPIGDAIRSDELDMRLKGSDRALKLMGVGQTPSDLTINFIGHSGKQQEIYDL